MNREPSQGVSGKFFAFIFLILLIGIFVAFVWFVQSATALLPQENEIVPLGEAVRMIEAGDVERVLIQRQRDVFLYQPNQARPLYTQLELGQTFTTTLESFGVTPERFPPITVER
jgi:hypothetical protein